MISRSFLPVMVYGNITVFQVDARVLIQKETQDWKVFCMMHALGISRVKTSPHHSCHAILHAKKVSHAEPYI